MRPHQVRELPLKRTSTYSSSYFNKFFTCLYSVVYSLELDQFIQVESGRPLSNLHLYAPLQLLQQLLCQCHHQYYDLHPTCSCLVSSIDLLFGVHSEQINNYSSIPLCDFLLKWIYIVSILDKLLCFLFIDPIQLRDKVYAFESVSQTSGSFISRIVAAFFFPAFLTLSWNLCLAFISMISTRVVHGYPTFSSSSALSASLLLSVFTLLSSPLLSQFISCLLISLY